jgi:hypothetical protein
VSAFKEKKDSIAMKFIGNMKDLTVIILELSDHLERWPSIKSVINKNHDLTLVLTKGGVSWPQFRTDVTLALKKYFSAGIDFEGEWPEENAREIVVQVFLDKFVKAFEFPVGLSDKDQQAIENLLGTSKEIESLHFTKIFPPHKTLLAVTPCKAYSDYKLREDVYSVFSIFDPEHDYLFFCGDTKY